MGYTLIVGTSGHTAKSFTIIQWTMMVFGFLLMAGVIFREAMLMLSDSTTTLMDNWPLFALGAIFFLGGLSCWFTPHTDHNSINDSENNHSDL